MRYRYIFETAGYVEADSEEEAIEAAKQDIITENLNSKDICSIITWEDPER